MLINFSFKLIKISFTKCFLNDYKQFIKKDTRNELAQNLSVLTFKYVYIMADDFNLRRKTILSLYNTYPSGNIIVSFQH